MQLTRNIFLSGLAVYLFGFNPMSRWLKLAVLTGLWLADGGLHWCYLFRHTFLRDIRLAWKGIRLLAYCKYLAKWYDWTVVSQFRKCVKKYPRKVMLVNCTSEQEWTYTEVEEYSNRVANYFHSLGYKKGDSVAFFMENRPEYIATWLGLAKIGVTPALINFNLKQQSLIHTILVSKCKAIIYGIELEKGVIEVYQELCDSQGGKFPAFHSSSGSDPKTYQTSCESTLKGSTNLDEAISKMSSSKEPDHITKSIHYYDTLLYIYTSGTTGLPKAVVISHVRQLFATIGAIIIFPMTHEDVVYSYLPLYHSSGGQLATAGAFFTGTKTIIKKKFSASSFWKDIVKYDVTATQYIGEIARYLLAQPVRPEEKQHKIKYVFGNGLRPQIWETFTSRFNIPRVVEFYGATEGNCSMTNIENKVGAVGFTGRIEPGWLQDIALPIYVIKVDRETNDVVRDPITGFCKEAADGEAGEFVGKIVRGDPIKDFKGYQDKEATEKKILRDVFKKGDLYFRSGDYMMRDELGWIYFMDRFGDTFRWKGENVSTMEVEATVSNVIGLKDATSYGVEIPGMDGRAGMIAIGGEPDMKIDFEQLFAGVKEKLPSYAKPYFIRIVSETDMTGTFKLKKRKLQKEGFNPRDIVDPLYFVDVEHATYIPLSQELHDKIVNGQMKL